MKPLHRLAASLQNALRTVSPNCREASRLQSEALDRSLPFSQRFGLRVHLLLCRWCRRYGKQIHFLRQATHEHPEEAVEATPRTLSPEARERLKRSLREKAK